MDLVKQYIVQSIAAASNNLRLNTQKIEIVAMLREAIIKSENLEADIKNMKKITELSKLAIRFSEIHTYLTQPQIDLFKFSDKLKEHSQILIKDLSFMLDIINPAGFRLVLEKLKPEKQEIIEVQENNSIKIDLSKRKTDPDVFEKPETEVLKEQIILEDDKQSDDLLFQNYETDILKPIKQIDNMLKQLSSDNINKEELRKYSALMKKNAEISENIGFDIIANMHNIISQALGFIEKGNITPNAGIIESMRACLIVIVAVVRGKEVDITNYLNRAEEFGRKILSLK